ncbi:hypothetical protein [Glycomyces tenuis]|uniref:hypothetical protein n=1 Tax=Glycomyces tenuis TaxID=58116 RepID=UPI0004161829|nr:hypothetical protein [Glycomyces tenuis]
MYDQNRPEEPQRPPGDDRPARRRIGRSWGPAEEPAAEAEEGTPQPVGQQQEPYRFDPDRGRRHRYSEDPSGQTPGMPVEIAETGPMVPATRRPSPGEQQQFEPIPPAPQHQQAPQPESPFAPPGANQGLSAPPGANPEYGAPGANHDRSTPPGANHDRSTPSPGMNGEYSAPPGANPDYGAQPPGANPEYGPGPAQQFSAPPSPHAPSAPQGATPPAPPAPANHPTPPPPENTEQTPLPGPVHETAPNPTPSAPALPSPPVHGPVTEQVPPRTPPASRQPPLEPTPPATPDDDVVDPDSEQLLAWVRQVPGVRDAFHVTSPDGSPSLRLELEDGVDPDEVQAAVSAVVAEQRGSSPGPQTVDEPDEDAQAEPESAVPAEAELPRVGAVELRRVEIDSAGLDAEVSVTLAVGDYESSGAVTVPPIDWHVQHAAAAATVEALRPHFGDGDARIEVEHASIVATGPVKTAVVVVLWLDGQAVRRLAGAAVVTSERSRAVVSATLSALATEVAL